MAWIFVNAEYVFTNSFHGCCLSIIMNKQFFVGARDGQGKKIPNLLNIFDLSWRKLDTDNSPGTLPKIDYGRVEELRIYYSELSSQYILNAIHNLEYCDHHPLISDSVTLAEHVLSQKWTKDELRLIVQRLVKHRIFEPLVRRRVIHLAKKILFWNKFMQ